MSDQDFLLKAIAIGNQQAAPYNFGAVIVKDGQVMSAEHGHVHETNNPSLHAEISAIVTACKKTASPTIDGATLYASHEPCAMCLSCAAWAHIERIVYAIPASEQPAEMYELSSPDIRALAKLLARPINIEQLKLF